MNTSKRTDLFAAGLAIFAMFFGAGNIIFPLAIGQFALDKTPYALLGFLITAVAMPFTGLLTMFLCKGQVGTFFGRMGKIPGLLLACFTIALMGPFGCAPRCIVLAHATLSMTISGIPLGVYAAISCLIIFGFVYRKGSFLKLIGYVLSPFKILLLVSIIFVGFATYPEVANLKSEYTSGALFMHGLTEGFNTMDLIGSFFFAPVIAASLIQKENDEGVNKFLFKACMIGAILLATVYIGFCLLASTYASELVGIPPDRLLGAIAIKVLGPLGGILVSATVAITCLTTAIALIASFTTFIHKEVLSERINYIPILLGTLAVTFVIATLGFSGIASFVGPALEMLYPILIALTLYNLVYHFFFNKEVASMPVLD